MRSRFYLLSLVFIAGACSLGLELVTSSLLAPYFGTSRLVWANVIGLTLIYLTLGYVWGGRVADRRPELPLLCALIAAAGLFVAFIPELSRPILGWSLQRFASSDAVLFGSLFGVLALFSIPMILLGMVSPFAIRLEVRDLRSAGSTAGTLYALSTVGSILGTFLPTLFLTPWIGTRRTLYVFAFSLLMIAFPGLWTTRRLMAIGTLTGLLLTGRLLAAPPSAIKPATTPGGRLLYESESPYNYLQVVSGSTGRDEVRYLLLNQGGAIHSVYNTAFTRSRDPTDLLTHACWDLFSVAPYFYPDRDKSTIRSLALIGLGAGTVPKQFLAIYGPQTRIDGVEIDPRIVAVGRTFFAMEDRDARYPNYRTHVQDGRVFITLTRHTYDVIGIDAYRPLYIPCHLSTREFFQSVRRRLNPDGVAVLNVIGGMAHPLGSALASTMRAVFPQVFLIDTPSGNILMVGVNRPVGDGVAHFRHNYQQMKDPTLHRIMASALQSDGLRQPVHEWTSQAGGFTDDWAPIDWMMDRQSVLKKMNKLLGKQ